MGWRSGEGEAQMRPDERMEGRIGRKGVNTNIK